MPDNSQTPYLGYYFKFQQGFKPIKTFQVPKDIIIEAMKTLSDVLKNEKFFDDIKLIYPNYFTEKEGGLYQPIADDLIFFNTTADDELKDRVMQHMSYYLVPRNSVTSTDTFVRISKSLIQCKKVSLSSFFVWKYNDKYKVRIHDGNKWDDETEINNSNEFPDVIDVNRLDTLRGVFDSFKGIDGVNTLSVQGEDLVSLPEGTVVDNQFNSSETFAKVFQKPLSAHFVMLQNASLLYVYSQTAQIDKSNNLGYGGLFILLKAGLSNETIEQYRGFFQLISDSISICIAHNIMREKQLREAVKSAKAAIMSRNLSHNLGSHVMAYLKKHLSSVTTLLQDNVLSDFITAEEFNSLRTNQQGSAGSVTFTKSFSKVEEGIALPFLVGLGNFISYLQERQDFIATIATDYIPYYSTVNFKDFIYDELNPDKRYLRHKDRKNLRPDNILLGNIARSEGLGRPTNPTESEKGKIADIVIKFEDFDGDPVVNESNRIIENREGAAKSLGRMRDVNVGLPGGLVGRQAIFSIVENIVRNASKHGNWRSKGKLELTFNIYGKEELNDIIEIIKRRKELEDRKKDPDSNVEAINNEINAIDSKLKDDAVGEHYSLKEVIWLFYCGAIDISDLYIFTITDNSDTSYDTVTDIRKALLDDYINKDDGVMREENKGIKELRISAAWLRGARDESEYYYPNPQSDKITAPQSTMKAPLMYVRLSKNKNKLDADNGHLQYIFCLRIPKKLAIVSKENIDIEAKSQLTASYWSYYSPDEFIEAKNKSFDFVLCDGEDCFKKVRPYSTSKIVDLDLLSPHGVDRNSFFEKVKSGIKPEDCNTVELALYNHFSLYKEGDLICVDDKKAYSKVGQEEGWSEPDQDSGLLTGKKYMKKGHIVVTDGGGCGVYVYRTHHDSIAEFGRFMNDLKDNFADCRFVESITGNTSTDRLVRNSVLDDRWFYAHLRAMKMKVAVFDERLFSNISGLQEVSFTHAKLVTKGIEDMKKEYISLFGSRAELLMAKYNDPDELNKYVTSKPYFRKKLYSPTAVSKGNAAASFFQKGICFFTLIRDVENERKYGIYGLNVSDSDKKDVLSALTLDDGFSSTFMKLADLEWDAENQHLKVLELANGGEYIKNGFDYISIHQGLLDKLYEAFGIQKTDVESKDNLTQDLYLLLKRVQVPSDTEDNVSSILEKQIITNGGRVFLPGITIHSGRSKPSSSDMPQLLPFIQYAAIEHATMDCKFSLVELLDNARYE